MFSNEKQVAQFYKKKQVESATPSQLVLLLYDAFLDHLNRAEIALAETDLQRIEKYHNNMIFCQNVMIELMSSLELERGGEIAKNLYRLYEYIHYRLISSNIYKGNLMITEVKQLLSTLREGWTYAVEKEIRMARVPPASRSQVNLKG